MVTVNRTIRNNADLDAVVAEIYPPETDMDVEEECAVAQFVADEMNWERDVLACS